MRLIDTVSQAPDLLPDVDDTSLAIATLRVLGRTTCIKKMVKEFKTRDHFKTYAFEKNPSFSANCNVLTCLLSEKRELEDNVALIEKCVHFLCESWWNTDQKINDKWVNCYTFVGIGSLWHS